MADKPVVHIGENSLEYVALSVTKIVFQLEKRDLYASGNNPPSRKEFLDTYAECLQTIMGNRSHSK